MLTSEVKRKIDSARDILVGKIPDPKAQVEQITTALIYKFMDDMDKESVELGGKARFFTEKFEKYSWTKLMDPKLGGIERLNLYVEAISQLNQNPNVPPLFRDIFKDAFLPYRSPETLNLFLKEINGFRYEHSEDLGDAYEYLLSVLGSQGDAGQFRTPRHIINFIVSAVDPTKDDKILDPACGTAGFLISAYKNIERKHDGKDDVYGFPTNKEAPLTPDERKTLVNNFVGYDISPDMVRISRVNMYLHGFPSPTIHEYDTLSSDERWDEMYDVILANPPFMTPKGGIRPHKRFPIQANRSEVLFVTYILEHLKVNGRAGIIVPEGIIFQSGNAYKQLRKMLVEDGLLAVVSLPQGVFNPYAGVKTSILLFDVILSKKTKDILFLKISNDGYDLGAQRKAIDKNDLLQALEIIKRYKKHLSENHEFKLFEQDIQIADLISKENIAADGDYNLTGSRYKDILSSTNKIWPEVEMSSVADFVRGPFGSSIKKSECVPKGPNTYKVYEQGNVIRKDFGRGEYYIDEKKFNELKRFELIPGDVLITCAGTIGKVAIAPDGIEKGIINSVLMRIRTNDKKILKRYLTYLLESGYLQSKIAGNVTGVAIKNMFATSLLKKIKIPMPPIEVQKEIVSELDRYKKIIEGAKQIIENYKPNVDIDPSWDTVELGDERYFRIESGGTPSSNNKEYWNGDIHWATLVDLPAKNFITEISSTERRITNEGLKNSSAKLLPPNSILVSSRATIGRIAINKIEVATNQGFKNIIIKDQLRATPTFVAHMVHRLVPQMEALANGGTFKEISKSNFSKLVIPLPPIEVQKEIEKNISDERVNIESATLIANMFEQKIKSKIAEVWNG